MLSRRLQRILAKKKKFQSGRRYFKKNKDFKRPDGKDQKKNEPLYYECKKPGHMKAECPKLKKPEFRKKDNYKKFRRYKKKAMAAAWENSSDSDSESSCSSDEEKTNLAFMANTEDKGSGRRHLGVKPRPLSQCQRPDMDANTNSGVQRYRHQFL
ncbi:hypothetical protein Taro_015022, partial [Colocasia esculenta]|nr:hypothetical protein [Colocasia esculenta]